MTYTPEQITAHIADRAQHIGEDSPDVQILRQILAECDAAWGDALKAAAFLCATKVEAVGRGRTLIPFFAEGGQHAGQTYAAAILSLTKDNSHE